MASRRVSADTLTRVVEPVVTAAGADLEGIDLDTAGRRRRVRVIVDADGGVDLDAIAEISRAVSAVLDEQDLFGAEPYVLEVTSRGVDTPLTLARHWRRNVGRLVKVTLRDGGTVTERISGFEGDTVHLESGRTIALPDVTRAVVEPELTRRDDAISPDPGAEED